MTRTYVRRRIAAVALVAGLAGLVAGGVERARPGDDTRPVSSTRYVVRPGDTLWSIAERTSPGADPRPLVDAIVRANGVDPGALLPGQVLVVPAG